MKKKFLKMILLSGLVIGTTISNPAMAAGAYCREFTQSFSVGGRIEQGYGTACLQPDGSWKIASIDGNMNIAAPETNALYVPEANVQYIVKEKVVYVPQRRVLFTWGNGWNNRWHHKPERHRPHHRHW